MLAGAFKVLRLWCRGFAGLWTTRLRSCRPSPHAVLSYRPHQSKFGLGAVFKECDWWHTWFQPRTITSIESKRDRALCQHGELKFGISHWRIHQDVEADHSMIYLDRSTEECGDNELGIPITLVGTIYLHMELRPHLYTFTLPIHLIIDAHGLLIKPRNSHTVRQRFPNFRTHFILFSLSY